MATTSNTDIGILKNKKILQFPIGLGSNEKDRYGNDTQYMLFKINTDTKSTKLRDDSSLGQNYVPLTRSGVGIDTNFGSSEKNTDSDIRELNGNSAVDSQEWVVQKGMIRLDRVIVLPMVMEHNMNTSIAYTQEYNPSILSKAGDMISNMGTGLAKDVMKLAKNAGISGLINKAQSGITSLDAMLAEERLAINPKKEVMFQSFGFRQFSFKYSFSPKSKEESEIVTEIIETFRYYSLPEISDGKLFYIFPSEFEVSFMLGSKINPNIPKMTTCVLQRVGVNYSPNGIWATLPNGAPIAIDLTLEFLELEMIDRKRVFNKNSKITSGY